MRRPLPGKGVVEDEHVDAWCADLELALDVLLVGIASGCGNEHLGNKADRKSETEAERAPWILWADSVSWGRKLRPREAECLPHLRSQLSRVGAEISPQDRWGTFHMPWVGR